ncbi:hypothetical protein MJ923_05030 [Shewanella sp. 3B26]|uniref:Uncharacterized protein n=1 Tax=Shewanella zhuhaiensis TaxID=2919576 RepID=A0AAJ1BF77_9GAMM|nr:hypothetical protein [Shewanella zhuhaiensis]MCH4293665.1 hypothetical protein [Shewanella zhuhaiensis]
MPLSYSIRIDFDPDSPRPERVFEAMALYVKGFDDIQSAFILGYGNEVKCTSVLASTRVGSCIADISLKIAENIRGLSFTKIFNSIYLAVQQEITADNTEIKSLEDAHRLADRILTQVAANEDHYAQFTSTPSCDIEKLVNGLHNIHEGHRRLTEHDLVDFGQGDVFSEVSKSLSCPYKYEELLRAAEETQGFVTIDVLVVRRPSYVPGLQWDCELLNGRKVTAKFTDQKWFKEWLEHEHEIWPGDAIEAKVRRRITTKGIKGKRGRKSGADETIQTVIRVIPRKEVEQMQLSMDLRDAQD